MVQYNHVKTHYTVISAHFKPPMSTEIDISNQKFEEYVHLVFDHVLLKIFKMQGFTLKPMRRKGAVSDRHNMTLGYTNLQSKNIVLDLYTPKRRSPKSINGILRVLAHEIAHHQKPPYRQRHKGRWIIRQHYPAFYKQVTKNINKIKKDTFLKGYFRDGE